MVWISWPGRICPIQTQDKTYRSKLHSLLITKMSCFLCGRNISFIVYFFALSLLCFRRKNNRLKIIIKSNTWYNLALLISILSSSQMLMFIIRVTWVQCKMYSQNIYLKERKGPRDQRQSCMPYTKKGWTNHIWNMKK